MKFSTTIQSVLLVTLCLVTSGCVTTAPVASGGDGLHRGCNESYEFNARRGSVVFYPGRQWKTCSNYVVAFQTDGNLVVYNPEGAAIWSSNTQNRGASQLAFQTDGNLVIYGGKQALWNSGTAGQGGATLRILPSGSMGIYNSDMNLLWTTAARKYES
jgi:hypothetical protein